MLYIVSMFETSITHSGKNQHDQWAVIIFYQLEHLVLFAKLLADFGGVIWLFVLFSANHSQGVTLNPECLVMHNQTLMERWKLKNDFVFGGCGLKDGLCSTLVYQRNLDSRTPNLQETLKLNRYTP